MLVNNAGTSYDHPELFTHVSEETIARILQLNVAGVTGVARQVLPGMMERRKGVVINIGSAAGSLPSPYLAVYSASKMYVDKLSADLAAEAKPRGVTVQYVLPGPVATKMSKIKYVHLLVEPARTLVTRADKVARLIESIRSYGARILVCKLIQLPYVF